MNIITEHNFISNNSDGKKKNIVESIQVHYVILLAPPQDLNPKPQISQFRISLHVQCTSIIYLQFFSNFMGKEKICYELTYFYYMAITAPPQGPNPCSRHYNCHNLDKGFHGIPCLSQSFLFLTRIYLFNIQNVNKKVTSALFTKHKINSFVSRLLLDC